MALHKNPNAPKKKQAKSPKEGNGFANKKSTNDQIPIAEIHLPSASIEYIRASDRRQERRDRWKLTIEIGTFLVVLAYTSVAYRQWNAMLTANSSTQQAAQAAATQAATSQKQLQLSERPWILASHEIDKEHPLTFLNNGSVVIELKETLENSGDSAAINVGSFADLVPIGPEPSNDWTAALSRQTQYCDQHRAWNKEVTGSNLSGFTLFPKHEITISQATGLTAADLAKAVSTSSDPAKRVGFYIIGCVWYRNLFESSGAPYHQTRFNYILAKRLGPQEGTFATLKSGISLGEQPMIEPRGTPEGLELIPEEWGNNAD